MSELIIKAKGDINCDNIDEIENQIKKGITGKITKVVMDLAKAELMDSLAIGMVIKTGKALQRDRLEFALTNVRTNLYELFCLIRFDTHFEILPLNSTDREIQEQRRTKYTSSD